MDDKRLIQELLAARVESIRSIAASGDISESCLSITRALTECFSHGGKVMFCGNGGSAADAQHLSAELSGKFYLERRPLPAEALHVNSSYITAVANDISFTEVYSRLVEARGTKGDILVAISTSGSSPNILKAATTAREKGMTVIGFTGAGGDKLADISDIVLRIPSYETPVIQEGHITIGHIICQMVESKLFGE